MTRRTVNPKVVSERLKELRKEKKITQQEVVEKTGISINSLKNYESARRIPDRYNLQLLSDFFRVDEEYILGSSDYKNIWHKYDIEHTEQVNKVKIELHFWEYASFIGCEFGSNDDEKAETFFIDVTEYMKHRFCELMKGE